MLKAKFIKHPMIFNTPGGTSRGLLHEKNSWFIKVWDEQSPELVGWGECSILKDLSYDDRPDLESKITEVCSNINYIKLNDLIEFPALEFAIEMALLDLKNGGDKILFPSDFTKHEASIPINGLIWMGKPEFMLKQINEKLEAGFNCLKLKIGAIDFKHELEILKSVRKEYSAKEIEIRVDANGAFSNQEALEKLKLLSALDIHSIEQPIKADQYNEMAKLCKHSPLPIALDEELIGIFGIDRKSDLLERIKPQYIILKPSLLGGFDQSEEWIKLAQEQNIGWWVTSALESNIGLNAIAQWTYTLKNKMPQGLGTGQVFRNNFPSPLAIEKGHLKHQIDSSWNLNELKL